MSFVVVLPAEPTTATTCASLFERTSEASAASAASWSSGTSVAAPRARASSTNATPALSATKRSPGPTSRESALIPVISPLAVEHAELERDDLVPGQRDHDAPPQRLARDVAVVERRDDAVDVLALLVPLAGDHDDVAVLGERDRARDRAPPVRVDLDVHAGSLEHVLDDRERLLGARVVGRHDRDVGELGGDLAHERPLAAVAVAARAEDDDDATGPEPAGGARAPSRASPGVCA